jgi:tRNA (guanine37-N1)-methyltransferase
MKFVALTIFPEMFQLFWDHGIVRRAIEQGVISASAVNIREFAAGRHQVTDDRPYGGGNGMVMKPEPLAAAIRWAENTAPGARTVYLSPQGRAFNQEIAAELSVQPGLILICGRYEGIDERICQQFVDDEISIGDYVLTGGELPAMVLMEAVIRLIPGALGGEESAQKDSFSDSLLEHGHYTRPANFEGEAVPDVLLSGNHAQIEKWRQESSLIRTVLKRRDLLMQRQLTLAEVRILQQWRLDIDQILQSQSISGAGTLPGRQ